MNKKGDAILQSITWLWKIVPVMVIAVFIVAVSFNYLSEDFETERMEDLILSTTLRYSPNCLAATGENGNVLPNILDPAKFDNFKLGGCYSKTTQSYKTTLLNAEGVEIASAKLIPVNIEKVIPVCDSIPEYECFTREDYVLYRKDGTDLPGVLRTEVIRNVD